MMIFARFAFSAVTIVSVLGFSLAARDAQALNLERSFVKNATGTCQSALPVFDGQIFKRPLAIQNEGTASAFISCSLMSTNQTPSGITEIVVFADNNNPTTPIDLTCTLITGLSKFGMQQFITQTISIAANSRNQIIWNGSNNNGNSFNNFTVNVSCNLPMGAGLSMTRLRFLQDVGA
ncbi:MAG: hypothetical protein ABJA62_08130 [Luteimonas sp.]